MIVRYFKSAFPVQYITIGVIGLLIWGIAAYDPPTMPFPDGPIPFYSILFNWVSGIPYLALAIGFLLVLFEAILLNYIFSKHDLIRHNTSLAALLFLLFISFLPQFLTLTPVNITILILLFFLNALLKAFSQIEPVELIFTAGFFISLASFFYFPAILLYGFLMICFLVYRTVQWREWISSFVGLVTPYIFLFAIYFLADQLRVLIEMYSDFFTQLSFSFPVLSSYNWVMIGLAGLFTILGFWDTVIHMREKSLELRKKTIILAWLFFWILITLMFSGIFQLYHIGLFAICLASFVTNFYLNLRKPFLFQLLFWLFILAIFANTTLFFFQ